MELRTTVDQELVLIIAGSWDRLLSRLDLSLSTLKGITFAEYRLIRAIAQSPSGELSRVDLAERVRLSPSGVTRALQPLEKLGFVETRRGSRDARLALAALTAEGEGLAHDACGVVNDVAGELVEAAPSVGDARGILVGLLGELAA